VARMGRGGSNPLQRIPESRLVGRLSLPRLVHLLTFAIVLVVISGLSGTGKSTVGEAVARQRRVVWLSVDAVEDALLSVGLPSDWTTGVAAYEAVAAAATENLRLGHSVIVDAVNDSEAARDTWRRAAEAASAPLVFVLLTPPDEREHRRRLRERTRPFAHQSEPTWEQVQARARRFEPWRDPPVTIDSGQPLEIVVEQVGAILPRRRA